MNAARRKPIGRICLEIGKRDKLRINRTMKLYKKESNLNFSTFKSMVTKHKANARNKSRKRKTEG
jgi:hypothetical protein